MAARTMQAEGLDIRIFDKRDANYICLTDIAKRDNNRSEIVLQNWMRNRDTIQFLGVWEKLHNYNFKVENYEALEGEAGLNSFTLSPKKWIETTNAKGIISKKGRGGGTYAHPDIALGFCFWLSPAFALYVVKEFRRLKIEESEFAEKQLNWDLRRQLSKLNHSVHTDAIKSRIPPTLTSKQAKGYVYASEVDLLNVAMFGITAREYKEAFPEAKGNIRDTATEEELLVLSNLQALNAALMRQGLSKNERALILNKEAIDQMRSIIHSPSRGRFLDMK